MINENEMSSQFSGSGSCYNNNQSILKNYEDTFSNYSKVPFHASTVGYNLINQNTQGRYIPYTSQQGQPIGQELLSLPLERWNLQQDPDNPNYVYERKHQRNGVPETIELNEEGLPAHWTLTRKLGLAGGIGATVGTGLTVAGAATLTTAYTTGVIVKGAFVPTGIALASGVGTVLWPIGVGIIGFTGLVVGGTLIVRNVYNGATWRTLKRALDENGQNKKRPAYLFCNAAKHAWEDKHYEKKELIDLIKEAKSLKEDIDDLQKGLDDVKKNGVGFPRSLWTTQEERLQELSQKLSKKQNLVGQLKEKIFTKFQDLKLKEDKSNEKAAGVFDEGADIGTVLEALQQKQFYTDYVEKHLYDISTNAYLIRDSVTSQIFQCFPVELKDKKGLTLAKLQIDQKGTPYYKIFDPPKPPDDKHDLPDDWKSYNYFIKRKGKDPYQQPLLPQKQVPVPQPVPPETSSVVSVTQPVVPVPETSSVVQPPPQQPQPPYQPPVTTTTSVVQPPVPQYPPVVPVQQVVPVMQPPVQNPQVVQQVVPVTTPVPPAQQVPAGVSVHYTVAAPVQNTSLPPGAKGWRTNYFHRPQLGGPPEKMCFVLPAGYKSTHIPVHPQNGSLKMAPVNRPYYGDDNDLASIIQFENTHPGENRGLIVTGQPSKMNSFNQSNPFQHSAQGPY